VLLPRDHPEQRGLTCAVRADHAYDAARRQLEVQLINEQTVAIRLANFLRLDDRAAETRAGRDDDIGDAADLLLTLLQQLVVFLDARLVLGLPCPRRGCDPLLLRGKRALARALLL